MKIGFIGLGQMGSVMAASLLQAGHALAAMMETLAETSALMQKSGIAPKELLNLGLKDMRLVLQAAAEVAAPKPLVSLIRDHMLSLSAQGQGNRDWSIVAQVRRSLEHSSIGEQS